jgi:hypothetical protein
LHVIGVGLAHAAERLAVPFVGNSRGVEHC